MATRRITRSVAALEELYNENEEDSVTENDSDTDDAVDAEEESSHEAMSKEHVAKLCCECGNTM